MTIAFGTYPISISFEDDREWKYFQLEADHSCSIGLSQAEALKIYHALGDWLQINKPAGTFNSWSDDA